LAFNYGKRGGEGNRPNHMDRRQLWGKRAESLSEYLIKGKQVSGWSLMISISKPTKPQRAGLEAGGARHQSLNWVVAARARKRASTRSTRDRRSISTLPGSQVPGQQRRIPPGGATPSTATPRARPAPAPSTGGGDSGFDDMDDDVPF